MLIIQKSYALEEVIIEKKGGGVLMIIVVNCIPRFDFAMVSRILEMEQNNNNNINV